MSMTTKQISTTELNVGDIVRFYGARFEIYSTAMYPERDDPRFAANGPVMVAMGKWLDGEIVRGYFGPGKDWNFQGNKLARVTIETQKEQTS
jgi:hypothetical protein